MKSKQYQLILTFPNVKLCEFILGRQQRHSIIRNRVKSVSYIPKKKQIPLLSF